MESEHHFGREAEFPFEPSLIWIISFPHLQELIVIDARPEQTSKRAFLFSQEEILDDQLKQELQEDYQQLLQQTETFFQAFALLPNLLRTLVSQRLFSKLTTEFDLQPEIVTEKIKALPISFLHCEDSAQNFWSCHQQSFFKSLGGEIDLIVDLRNCFQRLIEEEKRQMFKEDKGYYTLWQNPNLN